MDSGPFLFSSLLPFLFRHFVVFVQMITINWFMFHDLGVTISLFLCFI